MAKALDQAALRRLAQVGARARFQELKTEMAALVAAFPELRRARTGAEADDGAVPARAGGRRRRKRAMSAEQRRAVSERMRKYWAERRSAKK